MEKLLILAGIFYISYFGCQVFLNWRKAVKTQLETQAQNDIEMQRVISDIKSKVIKFEPRRPK